MCDRVRVRPSALANVAVAIGTALLFLALHELDCGTILASVREVGQRKVAGPADEGDVLVGVVHCHVPHFSCRGTRLEHFVVGCFDSVGAR